MLDGEGANRVARSLDPFAGFELDDLDGERRALEPERLGAIQHAARSAWPPESEALMSALERHGANQSHDAEEVVGVHVSEEDVLEREGDAVPHHLPLCALTAVEHERLSLA